MSPSQCLLILVLKLTISLQLISSLSPFLSPPYQYLVFLQAVIRGGSTGGLRGLQPPTPQNTMENRGKKEGEEEERKEGGRRKGGWRKKKGDEPPQRANPGSVTDYIIERKKYLFSVFHFYSESEES